VASPVHQLARPAGGATAVGTARSSSASSNSWWEERREWAGAARRLWRGEKKGINRVSFVGVGLHQQGRHNARGGQAGRRGDDGPGTGLHADGKLWVTDFGLARTGADAGLTMTGDVVGTLRYMSPEQALAKHGLVDHRTDVYALGATLYELLTLRPAVAV